jgi:hypothetical protein
MIRGEIMYRFTAFLDGEVIKQAISSNLEEFKAFCHYTSLSDWSKHKKLIEICLEKTGRYVFDGNDVKYYIDKE